MTHSWVLLSLPSEISEPRGGLADPDIVSDCLFDISIWMHNRDSSLNWPWNKLWYICNPKSALAAAVPISVNSNSTLLVPEKESFQSLLTLSPLLRSIMSGNHVGLSPKPKHWFPFHNYHCYHRFRPRSIIRMTTKAPSQSVLHTAVSQIDSFKKNLYHVSPSLTILQKHWKSKLPPLPYRPCDLPPPFPLWPHLPPLSPLLTQLLPEDPRTQQANFWVNSFVPGALLHP